MRVLCLSLHAGYACRHRGACCRTWHVAAEPHVVDGVRAHHGRAADPAFVVAVVPGRPERLFIRHTGNACVFRANEHCTIHRNLGEAALPVSCRLFPRVILRDPRGTLVAFSHYCPTAAALLLKGDLPARPVDAGVSVVPSEPLEGLDAREAFPPLLRPGVLTDIDGYDAWERAVIETLAVELDPASALHRITRATEEVRCWSPGKGPLRKAVKSAFSAAGAPHTTVGSDSTPLELVRRVYCGDVPLAPAADLCPAWHSAVPPERLDLHRAIANYLGARAFGNWVAYQGVGLRSVVLWLRACYDVLRTIALHNRPRCAGALTLEQLLEAIRLTDVVMLHSVDSHAFARAAAPMESGAARPTPCQLTIVN